MYLIVSPFWFIFQPHKMLEPFLTPQTETLKADSLLNEPISVNSAWSKTLCSFHHYPTTLVFISTHILWISVSINQATQVVLLNYNAPTHGSHIVLHL